LCLHWLSRDNKWHFLGWINSWSNKLSAQSEQ
jgi:hypothetical protein